MSAVASTLSTAITRAVAPTPVRKGDTLNLAFDCVPRSGRDYTPAPDPGRVSFAGRPFVVLFADLANPTSDRTYVAVGYEPVLDVDPYRFRD
ncbi:MAG TPA: hypothetical protein VFX65_00985 [Candidatus Limnocylindrales bacterium]|nr:hypothetical protein [Candidatus Limnocylindrales bacterium]